jgi:alkanesulfonate monooxygenase SsuD/methylene tetrahydromethanopterin reductase-like flavin-dependent oxidoreductase (luciferase family)
LKHPLRVGIKLSQDASIESYSAVWKIADEARFDHCWAMDHLATIGGIGDDRPIFDGWELLAGMATSTTHVRLGLLVTGITYRTRRSSPRSRPPSTISRAARACSS